MLKRLKSASVSKVRKLEVMLVVGLLVMLGTFYSVSVAQSTLGNWMFQQYTEPFLAHAPSIVQR